MGRVSRAARQFATERFIDCRKDRISVTPADGGYAASGSGGPSLSRFNLHL